MSETRWRGILEQIRCMPENRQAHLRFGTTTLLLERRGDVVVALRALPSSARPTHLPAEQSAAQESKPHWQLLRVSGNSYLCTWKRQPTDWYWLKTLATIRL